MVDRKKFDHALAMRQQLEAHYPDRNFQDAFQLSEELRDHFEIKLLVVGHFSAGKSALLNALLQRPASSRRPSSRRLRLPPSWSMTPPSRPLPTGRTAPARSCRLARNIFRRSTAIWNTM